MKKEPSITESFTASNGFKIEYVPDAEADAPLTEEELAAANFQPAKEVLPAAFFTAMKEMRAKPMGRPPSEDPKEATNIRYSKRLLAAFRATGKGWQTRMNDALMEWAKQHGML